MKVDQGLNTLRAMKMIFHIWSLSLSVESELNINVTISTVTYGAESRGKRMDKRQKLDVM